MTTITYNYVSCATAAQSGAGAGETDVADETRDLQPCPTDAEKTEKENDFMRTEKRKKGRKSNIEEK